MQRRKLNKTATRTVVVLVGLPARGKSFVARKLLHFFNWNAIHCKIFNVGRYRREAYAELIKETAATEREQQGACDANFFDASNEAATQLREKVAECALRDMLRWLDDEEDTISDEESAIDSSGSSSDEVNFKNHERVAIFDATNSTDKRRNWILEQCTSPVLRKGKQTGLVFVESICDDVELLEENYRYKISSSPDFVGMPIADALADLRMRVAKYEAQYETIRDDSLSYIKVFNLSTKLMVNHIYGRMAKDLVPALMAWHIGTRPVFLCRPGQTVSGILTDGEDYVNRHSMDEAQLEDIYKSLNDVCGLKGDVLGPNGKCFRQDLFDFLGEECRAFVRKRASIRDMAKTGTSISGLANASHGKNHGLDRQDSLPECGTQINEPFPLRIYTSTMPRAADTVSWDDFRANQRSNLNPLDKGDFAGMELDEIRKTNPDWYKILERDAFNTR
jgi:6-phosphofructo-2-kinase